jgi:hypothetical protein
MDSVEIPFVTSDVDARHDGHVLEELGAIAIPHMQHSTFTIVPAVSAIIGWVNALMY